MRFGRTWVNQGISYRWIYLSHKGNQYKHLLKKTSKAAFWVLTGALLVGVGYVAGSIAWQLAPPTIALIILKLINAYLGN